MEVPKLKCYMIQTGLDTQTIQNYCKRGLLIDIREKEKTE